MKVMVWLQELNTPIDHNAKSTYTKGKMFCVMEESGKVTKYPIKNIFRVQETNK